MSVRSRIAPTPSGYLHLGNALNAVLTWLIVRKEGGSLKLRIDDADADRARPEYVEDIFAQFDWLGIAWDEGPAGPDDFRLHHSQQLRIDRYREALSSGRLRDHTFPCGCSRRDIAKVSPTGLYPGTCRKRGGAVAPPHGIRLHVPAGTRFVFGTSTVDLDTAMGDFVLWRRDGRPAYQLASLVDDVDDRITLIVRGEDLLASSAAQFHLSRCMGGTGFEGAAILHHGMILCPRGKKLSKSDNALSLRHMRSRGAKPLDVYHVVARRLGIDPKGIGNLDDLLAAFRENASPAVKAGPPAVGRGTRAGENGPNQR